MTPTLLWFRRDFRLSDHAALTAAIARGGPVIPVFICDAHVDALGAAPKWRMEQAVAHFAKVLERQGSRLILRRGDPCDVLPKLVKQTGAGAVYWSRAYDPAVQATDTAVKAKLTDAQLDARSFKGHLLFEPWTVETKTGGFYRVYTPMWKAVRDRALPDCLPAPTVLPAPENWPASETLTDWGLGAAMNRGGAVVAQFARVGEGKAQARLGAFCEGMIDSYKSNRDLPSVDGTSRLSENLAYGEISPLQCWHAGWEELRKGSAQAEVFLKELVWREFAYHLLHHTPHITHSSWRPEWEDFPWATDGNHPHVIAWKRGQTGIPFVDAAMREMYTTGTIHNRGRMIVASYLTKHLLTHWRIGQDWFADCLIDWDPASNAMGWQWSAGSGPDATPYFRVFNPETQLDKFDPEHMYKNNWIAEGQLDPPPTALAFYEAIPSSWRLSPHALYPKPIVTAAQGRAVALQAYENRKRV